MNSNDQKTVLEQRTEKGIWQQLYQFPLIETPSPISEEGFLKHPELSDKLEVSHKKITLYNTTDIIHKLSHQELHIKFWIINTTKSTKNGIKWSDIGTLPVPIVIERFINNFQL